MVETVDLKDALAQFEIEGVKPDGFLYRVVVVPGEDLQPFSTSVYGLTVTYDLSLNRFTTAKDEVTYEIFDVVGFPNWKNMESEMKSTDKLLNQIIKQSLEMGHIKDVSQAVHFVNRPSDEIDVNPEDEDLF